MTSKELQKKSDAEITELLEEKRKALWNFRFGASGSKVRDVKEGVALRREIARVLTELSARKCQKNASH